jgi:hypothetical protein
MDVERIIDEMLAQSLGSVCGSILASTAARNIPNSLAALRDNPKN